MVWTTTDTLKTGLENSDSEAKALKQFSVDTEAAMLAGDVSANVVLDVVRRFHLGIVCWASAKALTGFPAYVAEQKNVVEGTVLTDINAMQTAAEAVRDQVLTDFPTATAPPAEVGKLTYQTLELDGSITTDTFTPAQTINIRPLLTAFVATVS